MKKILITSLIGVLSLNLTLSSNVFANEGISQREAFKQEVEKKRNELKAANEQQKLEKLQEVSNKLGIDSTNKNSEQLKQDIKQIRDLNKEQIQLIKNELNELKTLHQTNLGLNAQIKAELQAFKQELISNVKTKEDLTAAKEKIASLKKEFGNLKLEREFIKEKQYRIQLKELVKNRKFEEALSILEQGKQEANLFIEHKKSFLNTIQEL